MTLRLLIIAIGTYLTRVLPFVFFKNKQLPSNIQKLIAYLPYATISLLVVYCFKDINLQTLNPSFIASAVCISTYLWKSNAILSIGSSTIIYMILI